MSCRGVFFALTPTQDKRLRKAFAQDGDEGALEVVDTVEEEWDDDHVFETDKAWDGIHRCLTNDQTPRGRLNPISGQPPLNLCILGATRLYDGSDYIINLIG